MISGIANMILVGILILKLNIYKHTCIEFNHTFIIKVSKELKRNIIFKDI